MIISYIFLLIIYIYYTNGVKIGIICTLGEWQQLCQQVLTRLLSIYVDFDRFTAACIQSDRQNIF